MILLDTNVISELMRAAPDKDVLEWVGRQSREDLYTSSIVQSEILYGVATLPLGRRKAGLAEAAAAMFHDEFRGRVLAYDHQAAVQYADIVSIRRSIGRPIEAFDAMIAATARAHSIAVATRNIADFEECGVDLIDPWNEA